MLVKVYAQRVNEQFVKFCMYTKHFSQFPALYRTSNTFNKHLNLHTERN